MKKLLCLLSLVLLCTSCDRKEVATTQTLRLNLANDPAALDPRVVRTLKDLTVVKQLFEGLMRNDSEGNLQPAIAESFTLSDDLLTYTFKLREAYWNNGDRVTAHDFEYAWKKVLDPSFATDYSYMLYPIKNAQQAREGKCSTDEVKVKAVDETTLVVQLHTPTPYFLDLVAFPTYYPINHEVDLEQKGQLVSNGPFQLKFWTPKVALQMEKNPTYWDNRAVRLKGIVFSIITDNNTESQLYEKGELDWLGQPISHNIATEIIGQNRDVNSYSIAGTFWFKFNTEKKPFDKKKFRQAFAYAIDRKAIITHVLQGNQLVATSPVPPSMGLSASPYFKDADSKKAKELFNEALDEGGYTLEALPKIVLNFNPSERNSKIVQVVQQQWKEVLGVKVELASMERQTFQSKVKQGLYQVGIGDWIADFNDPIAFLEIFKNRTGGMNNTGWENERYISLLDRSIVETDPKKRGELLQEAEKVFVNEMPVAPIYHYAFDYLKQPYVNDVVLSPLGTADFKYAYIR